MRPPQGNWKTGRIRGVAAGEGEVLCTPLGYTLTLTSEYPKASVYVKAEFCVGIGGPQIPVEF